jgi:hypothetical protein
MPVPAPILEYLGTHSQGDRSRGCRTSLSGALGERLAKAHTVSPALWLVEEPQRSRLNSKQKK